MYPLFLIMKLPITVYGTNAEITEKIVYREKHLNEEMIPHHQREFYAKLVLLCHAPQGIPHGLIQRYGRPYETYISPTTTEDTRMAMRRAVESLLDLL